MKQFFIILALVLILFAFTNSQLHKTERPGIPTIYSVHRDDIEMNEAINSANQTIKIFEEALLRKDRNYKFFAIKSRFKTPRGEEHIWLRNIFIRENEYWGIVGNLPEDISEIEVGDTIRIINETISDWMFLDSGRLKGGYTIRLLRARMSDNERQKFDSANNIIIEDQ